MLTVYFRPMRDAEFQELKNLRTLIGKAKALELLCKAEDLDVAAGRLEAD
jgi:hypothetical protein